MPRPRNAKDDGIAAVFLSCAYCGAELSDPRNHALMIVLDDETGETLTCSACGKVNGVPRRYRRG